MNVGDLSKLVDREHLQRALINLAGCEDVQLAGDVQVESGTSGFEGFLSIVLRVKVSFTTPDDPWTRTKSLFVKCLPREKFQKDMVKMINVFNRESVYYGEVLPLMEKASAGRLNVPIPQCYHAFTDGSNDVIYLEDLVENGYAMAGDDNRTVSIDMEHSLLVARHLGKLHALTMSAERLLPPEKKNWIEAFPLLGEDPIYYKVKPGEPTAPFKGVADTGNEIVIEVAGKMSGLPRLAADTGKLRSVIEKFWSIVLELVKPNSKGHNVLCHGDCWTNNCLFKYQVDADGNVRPTEMKFVDFQMTNYYHPSLDLLFFMYLGMNQSYREKYFSDIITEYYNSLRNSLSILKFGAPPFSLEEFTSDLNVVYKPFAVYLFAVYSPCMQLGDDFIPKNAGDMTPELFQHIVNTGNVTAIRKRLDSDPSYRSIVEAAVNEFVEMVFPDGSVDSSPFLK